MASSADNITENDQNNEQINESIGGQVHLQRDIINFNDTHVREELERCKGHDDGTPLPSRGEELVAKRSEAQKKKKSKRPDDEINCALDAVGALPPVRVYHWLNEPDPLEDPHAYWDRRLYNLKAWGLKHYAQLFGYLEPSLFGGGIQPTDSLTVMKQLMERCFGYNTGVVAGQAPTVLRGVPRRTLGEQFLIFLKAYITNGRPLRSIKFKNGVVDWRDQDNGIYHSYHVDNLPPAVVRPTPADPCGFCVLNSLTGKYVTVPAIYVGTSNLKTFLALPIKLNHNEAAAKYEVKKGVPIEINKFSERAKQANSHNKPRKSQSKLALANSAWNPGGGSIKKTCKSQRPFV